jgi:hypothetical protein
MTHYKDETLVPQEVTIRRMERDKCRVEQQKQMNHRQVSHAENAWNQTISASKDVDIRDALTQVRQSDVTLPEALTRLHGTWVHNQK